MMKIWISRKVNLKIRHSPLNTHKLRRRGAQLGMESFRCPIVKFGDEIPDRVQFLSVRALFPFPVLKKPYILSIDWKCCIKLGA